MLKYPSCPICKAIKEQTKASDRQINAYHESKGSYEVFDKRDRDTVIGIMLELGTVKTSPRLEMKEVEHTHKFEQLDYDDGREFGLCEVCGHWIDTATGEDETEAFEREQERSDILK